jgi:Holliday junction resolvase RusA-like endonuclease
MPKVEEKLRRAVEQAVQQQMPDLYAALRIEIDVAIREEITKSLQSTVAFPTAKSGA